MNEYEQYVANQKTEARYTANAIRAHLATEPTPVIFLEAEQIDQVFTGHGLTRERLVRQIEALGDFEVIS